MEDVAVQAVQGHKAGVPPLYFIFLHLPPVNKIKEHERRECTEHNCGYSHKAASAGSYLSLDDLQDYVTNNMRRILQSEEKRNVLDRDKEKQRFYQCCRSTRTHRRPVYTEQGNSYYYYLEYS